MSKIKLLRSYKLNVKDEIIEVSSREAEILINDNVAIFVSNSDYLIKPKKFGKQISSRAFEESPCIK